MKDSDKDKLNEIAEAALRGVKHLDGDNDRITISLAYVCFNHASMKCLEIIDDWDKVAATADNTDYTIGVEG